ncbi:MAG: hypothetical protein JWN70_6930 [Planctomycetaceae bacterium]|nr:hypothetical protein [Planctomycetaceae bacterium]
MTNFFDRLVSPDAQHHDPIESSPDDDLQQTVDDVASTAEPSTAADVKRVAQELLKHGFLEESHKRELFRCAIAYEYEINVVLEPLDLEIRLDPHRGIAFLVVAPAAYTASDSDAAVSEPVIATEELPEFLDQSEKALYQILLRSSRGRLEQEFLPAEFVRDNILKWANMD